MILSLFIEAGREMSAGEDIFLVFMLVVLEGRVFLLFITKYIFSPMVKTSRFLLFYSLAGFH